MYKKINIFTTFTLFLPIFVQGMQKAKSKNYTVQHVIRAIETSKISEVQTIIGGKFVSPLKRSTNGHLPIQVANHKKQSTIVEYLKWPTMMAALESGDLEAVKWIINHQLISAQDKTKGGRSLAQVAADKGQDHIVKYFAETWRVVANSFASNSNGQSNGQQVSGSNTFQFYHRGQPYYEFTNFFESPVNISGKIWPTTEHYFQAQKFKDANIQQEIQRCKSAREVFDLANSKNGKYKAFIRSDWHDKTGNKMYPDETLKDAVMREALQAKFSQNAKLQKLLLDTGDARLVEASDKDDYWGGSLPDSKDMLGKLLMELREQLRKGAVKPKDQKEGKEKAELHKQSADWTLSHNEIAMLLEDAMNFDLQRLELITNLVLKVLQDKKNLRATIDGKTLRDLADKLDSSSWFFDLNTGLPSAYRPSVAFKEQWELLRQLLTA